VEAASGRTGTVTLRADVTGADFEDVPVGFAGEDPQHQAVTRTRRPIAEGEAELVVQILEFLGDPAPRVPGELRERYAHDGFATQPRGAKQRRDRLDRGASVIGLDDHVEYLVPTVERLLQGIGDVAAGGGPIVVGHDDERRTHRPGPSDSSTCSGRLRTPATGSDA